MATRLPEGLNSADHGNPVWQPGCQRLRYLAARALKARAGATGITRAHQDGPAWQPACHRQFLGPRRDDGNAASATRHARKWQPRQRGNRVATDHGQQDPLLWQPGCQRSTVGCAEEGAQRGCRSDSRQILGGRAGRQPGCQRVILGCKQYASQGCGNPVAKNIGGWQ